VSARAAPAAPAATASHRIVAQAAARLADEVRGETVRRWPLLHSFAKRFPCLLVACLRGVE
jgi:hypothetical protein